MSYECRIAGRQEEKWCLAQQGNCDWQQLCISESSREDFECLQHEKMIIVWDNRYAIHPEYYISHTCIDFTVPDKYTHLLGVN